MSSAPTPGEQPASQPANPAPAQAPAPAPAKKESRLGLVIFGAVLFCAIMTVAWFWEDIEYQFAARPSPEVVYGTWEFDRDSYRQMMSEMAGGPIDPGSPQSASWLKQTEDKYAGVVVTFQAGTVSVVKPGAAAAAPLACTYEAYPPNVLVVQPTGSKPEEQMHLAVDQQRKDRVYWSNLDVTIPLKRKL